MFWGKRLRGATKARAVRAMSAGMASLLMLSACATMTPTQCEIAEWRELGFQDARSGRAPDYLAARSKDCSEAGVNADSAAWRLGYRDGLDYFCVGAGGFDVGLNGRNYHGQCPPALEGEFLEGLRLGQEIHTLRASIVVHDRNIASLVERLGSEDLDERSRRSLRRDLDRNQSDVRRLERQLGRIEAEADLLGYSTGYWAR